MTIPFYNMKELTQFKIVNKDTNNNFPVKLFVDDKSFDMIENIEDVKNATYVYVIIEGIEDKEYSDLKLPPLPSRIPDNNIFVHYKRTAIEQGLIAESSIDNSGLYTFHFIVFNAVKNGNEFAPYILYSSLDNMNDKNAIHYIRSYNKMFEPIVIKNKTFGRFIPYKPNK